MKEKYYMLIDYKSDGLILYTFDTKEEVEEYLDEIQDHNLKRKLIKGNEIPLKVKTQMVDENV